MSYSHLTSVTDKSNSCLSILPKMYLYFVGRCDDTPSLSKGGEVGEVGEVKRADLSKTFNAAPQRVERPIIMESC